MSTPRISMIAAIAKDTRIIGDGPKIPWEIPEDMKFFKKTTVGHPIIMGRKTFESFGGRTLPNRTHFVITRNRAYFAPDEVVVLGSLERAVNEASSIDDEEIFIIGGGEIYRLGMEIADRLYLTIVDVEVEGDITFPVYRHIFENEISRRKSSYENYEYEFVVLEK